MIDEEPIEVSTSHLTPNVAKVRYASGPLLEVPITDLRDAAGTVNWPQPLDRAGRQESRRRNPPNDRR